MWCTLITFPIAQCVYHKLNGEFWKLGFSLSHHFILHICEVITYGDEEFEFNDNWVDDDEIDMH